MHFASLSYISSLSYSFDKEVLDFHICLNYYDNPFLSLIYTSALDSHFYNKKMDINLIRLKLLDSGLIRNITYNASDGLQDIASSYKLRFRS